MNKKTLFIIGVIVLIIAGGIVVKMQISPKQETVEEIPTPTVALPTVSESIIVKLTPKQDNKVVQLSVSGLTSDIESVEYELTYITGAGLPRGVLGKILTKGAEEISRDDIVLGTCSSGKCVYDSGVTSVDLSLKFNSPSGSQVFRKTYQL